MEDKKYPIKEEWVEYYKTLEAIRRTGVVNMFGAAKYLRECFPEQFSEEESIDVLCNWMYNYKELNKRFGWQN